MYAGFENGSLQAIQFYQAGSNLNPLFDPNLQATPVQVTQTPWTAPSEPGPVSCVGLSYDGTYVISGHESGKIAQWDTGRRAFASELADLNAPVTNILMLRPLRPRQEHEQVMWSNPSLVRFNILLLLSFCGTPPATDFGRAFKSTGFPSEILTDAIARFSAPLGPSSSGDEKIREENEELWRVVNEQQALQRKPSRSTIS